GRTGLTGDAEGRRALEVLTALYRSAILARPTDLPLAPDDPFYDGVTAGLAATREPSGGAAILPAPVRRTTGAAPLEPTAALPGPLRGLAAPAHSHGTRGRLLDWLGLLGRGFGLETGPQPLGRRQQHLHPAQERRQLLLVQVLQQRVGE